MSAIATFAPRVHPGVSDSLGFPIRPEGLGGGLGGGTAPFPRRKVRRLFPPRPLSSLTPDPFLPPSRTAGLGGGGMQSGGTPSFGGGGRCNARRFFAPRVLNLLLFDASSSPQGLGGGGELVEGPAPSGRKFVFSRNIFISLNCQASAQSPEVGLDLGYDGNFSRLIPRVSFHRRSRRRRTWFDIVRGEVGRPRRSESLPRSERLMRCDYLAHTADSIHRALVAVASVGG